MGFKRIILLGVISVVLFSAGFGTRALTADTSKATPASPASQYPLLAKRLFIDSPNESIVNFAKLRAELKQYVADNNLSGSLYFEYLPTGTSIRIDGDEMQVAASLFKLPAAMDLYRAAELGIINLDDTVTLRQEWLDPNYGSLYKKGQGYQLSLREAAKIMLEQSDNTALKAVALSTPSTLSAQDRAINALDVDIAQNNDLTISIGARSYSSFLKCLYFSCYLNNNNSQELLGYLSKSQFNDRLVAGIDDKSIIVAHKIGVANTSTQSDCGIVFIPSRNYTLCVMIHGQDNTETNRHIANISRTVYKFVKNK